MEFVHYSVMLDETIESLDIKPDGIYVDCTCGGAGHARAILQKLSDSGRLIAIDQDPDAIEVIKERIGTDKRVTVVKDNFSNLDSILKNLGIEKVSGILADLGVSSYQMDSITRGFSFNLTWDLDMRMSREGKSAYDVVNTYDEKALADIMFRYGEEKFSRSIARNIVRERKKKPIETTTELAEIVKNSIPAKARRTGGHPARKAFQAIRIEVNHELEVLSQVLDTMISYLEPGGRLSIITFHSLEDRLVKSTFKKHCEGCTCPKDFPVCVCGKVPECRLPFKFKNAGDKELQENNRSRSATLRTIEKVIITEERE